MDYSHIFKTTLGAIALSPIFSFIYGGMIELKID